MKSKRKPLTEKHKAKLRAKAEERKLAKDIDISHETINETITGVGDLIKKATQLVGIEPCEKCEERRKSFNRALNFQNMDLSFINDKAKELMVEINAHYIIKSKNVDKLFKLYNGVFKTKHQRCNCPALLKTMVSKLNSVI
jgi:hypothetical protein